MNRILFPIFFFLLGFSLQAQVYPSLVSICELERSISSSVETLSQIPELKPRRIIRPFECKIYPVLVESKLQVVLPVTENYTLRLVDSQGKVLFSHYQIFGENQVNLGHLKAAKYFVEISSDKGMIVEKITKT
jgi:hypothetical protein